jgi:hypothetical protein
MPSASRFKEHDIWDDSPSVFDDADRQAVAAERGVPVHAVAFAEYKTTKREGRQVIELRELRGTAGAGLDYDASQDFRAMQRATLQTLAAGAASTTTPAKES